MGIVDVGEDFLEMLRTLQAENEDDTLVGQISDVAHNLALNLDAPDEYIDLRFSPAFGAEWPAPIR